jgi:hypothetical protein
MFQGTPMLLKRLNPTFSHPGGPALVVPWHPGGKSVTGMTSTQCPTESVHGLENGMTSKVSVALPTMVAAPGLAAPAVPFHLVPPPWSCIPGWPNGMWSSSWLGSNGGALPSPPPNNIYCSGHNSPKLGNHSREEALQGEEKKEITYGSLKFSELLTQKRPRRVQFLPV